MDFASKLSGLVALEMSEKHSDVDGMANVLERLLHSVGFVIAIMGRGDPGTVDRLCTGAEHYLVECATGGAQVGKMLAAARISFGESG